MSQFVGLKVSVTLLDSSHPIVGTLSSIDANNGTLTVSQASQSAPSSPNSRSAPLVVDKVLRREQVRELRVLESGNAHAQDTTSTAENTSSPQTHPHPLVPAPPDKDRGKGTKRKIRKGRADGRDGMESEEADESTRAFESDGWDENVAALGGTVLGKEKRKSQTQQGNFPRGNRNRREARGQQTQLWKNEDVSNGYAEEFDFESGLKAFDKKKVYEQIRNEGNFPSTSYHTRNLAYNENVLDSSASSIGGRVGKDGASSLSDLSSSTSSIKGAHHIPSPTPSPPQTETDTDRAAPSTTDTEEEEFGRTSQNRTSIVGKDGKSLVTIDIERGEWRAILEAAEGEWGIEVAARNENAGRGVAMVVYGALLPTTASPVVVLLCGSTTGGGISPGSGGGVQPYKTVTALSAGANLCLRGSRVYACLGPGTEERCRTAVKRFVAAGGKLVDAFDDLPGSSDLIVDAILEIDFWSSTTSMSNVTMTPKMKLVNTHSSPSSSNPNTHYTSHGASGTTASSSSPPKITKADRWATAAAKWATQAAASGRGGKLLSIDVPSGVDTSGKEKERERDEESGVFVGINHVKITPTVTVCLGFVKTVCRPVAVAGDLYVVDVGFPESILSIRRRIGTTSGATGLIKRREKERSGFMSISGNWYIACRRAGVK